MTKTNLSPDAPPVIRTYYDGKQKQISDLTALDQTGEISLTKQADLASSDVNTIMAQYEKTGMLSHVNQYQGNYINLGDAKSYHDNMNDVLAAQTAFASLPADIRARFGNDPAAFLDFVSDQKNKPELIKMGLVHAPTAAPEGDATLTPEETLKRSSVKPAAKAATSDLE